MGSRATARPRIPDPEHAWWPARGKRRSHRTRLSHRPLGSGSACRRGRARAEIVACHTFRGRLHRPLRWSHSRHHRHDGLAAVSQRCGNSFSQIDALAAHGQRRDRRSHMRQRASGDDDGAGVVGIEARGAGSRRGHVTARARRGRGQGADHRCALCAEPHHAGTCRGGGLPGMRFARRRVPVSGHRGHVASGGRGPGTVSAAYRACALGATHLAGCRAPFRPRDSAPPFAGHGRRQHPHACVHLQRHDRESCLRRIDKPSHSPAGHCACGGLAATHGFRLGRGQSPGSALGGRAAQRPAQLRYRASVSGRRRA